jgi:hypothetical protein
MKPNEVYLLLCQGQLTLAFDTNAVFGHHQFWRICNKINQLNDKYRYEFNLTVSALVHTEKLFDLKQELKEKYNLEIVTQSLSSKRVSIKSFQVRHAEATASVIGKQFPTNDDWHKFKRQKCIDCLGLQRIEHLPGKGKTCGATIDWFIVGHAYCEDYLLITQDGGEEFKGIEKKTDLASLEAAVDQLTKRLQEAPGTT